MGTAGETDSCGELALRLGSGQEATGPIEGATEIPPNRLLPLLVLAATFLAYAGTLGFEFVYDDRLQIVSNSLIQSWRFVPRYFVTHVWANIFPDEPGNYYRPLFLVWLRLNHALFGLKPLGWHVTSIAAHLGVTFLVYLLTLRTVKDRPTAIVGAMIFGLHPVHIEEVAWVSGVTELLLALLLLPSFLCYLKYREPIRMGHGWLVLSLVLYALAMLAKETALVLPMIVCGYEWIWGRAPQASSTAEAVGQRFRTAFSRGAPYLALTALYLPARAIALKGLAHAVAPRPLRTVVLTIPSLLWFYLKQLVWPVGLSAFYDTPEVTDPGFLDFFLPAVGLVGVGVFLWAGWRGVRKGAAPEWRVREARAIAFAFLWLLLPLILVLNLSMFPETDVAHDRYLYLPSVGFSILAALAWRRINLGRVKLFGQPAVRLGVALALACLLGIGTVTQSVYWHDDLLLYYRGLTVAPHNEIGQRNLVALMSERGQHDVVVKLCLQILRRYPNSWTVNYNLGYAYYSLGNLEEAQRYLGRAITINQFQGRALFYLGLTRLKLGRVSDAEILIRHALEVQPEARGYHGALGLVLEINGDLSGALREFKAELANDPQQPAVRVQIARIEGLLQDPANQPRPSVPDVSRGPRP
jgi:tetratricopeptide (TPR) repeat protein